MYQHVDVSPTRFVEYYKLITIDKEYLVMAVKKKPKLRNKYEKQIKPGVWVDVYDTIEAYDVSCSAMQHAVKKCLMAGGRGHKDTLMDKQEAIISIQRSMELDIQRAKING